MPKVLIDIPDIPKNDHQRWVLTHGGIVLDGLTNGEMLLRLNETAQVYGIDKEKDIIKVCFDNENIVPISYSWWNRKWGETE